MLSVLCKTYLPTMSLGSKVATPRGSFAPIDSFNKNFKTTRPITKVSDRGTLNLLFACVRECVCLALVMWYCKFRKFREGLIFAKLRICKVS